MKTILITIYSILALVLTGGFASATAPTNAETLVAPAYEVIHAPYPGQVNAVIPDVRKNGGYKQVNGKNQTYLIIGLGKRPTGGYAIDITKIERRADGNVVVHVQERKPAQGKMKIQVISYPTTVVSIPKTSSTITVVFQ